MGFEDFLSARRYAQEIEKQAQAKIPEPESEQEHAASRSLSLTPEEVDYFIRLQTQSWGKGQPQNYHKYADALWRRVLGRNPKNNPALFEEFESRMIVSLHNLDTRQFVYPGVQEGMHDMVQKYGADVEKVVLWSTGDVSQTGYQIAKVDQSRIIIDFLRALEQSFPKPEAHQFIRDKTAYMVDDNKFDRLAEYTKAQMTQHPKKDFKLVVIEDVRSNLSKAQKTACKAAGDEAQRVHLVPIWAAYSRHARIGREQAEARGQQEQFLREKRSDSGIDSFAELGNTKRFRKIFKNAHVFIDFDGVISDDDARRKAQAESVCQALLDTAKKVGVTDEVLHKMLRDS